jgi:hypothetical protein
MNIRSRNDSEKCLLVLFSVDIKATIYDWFLFKWGRKKQQCSGFFSFHSCAFCVYIIRAIVVRVMTLYTWQVWRVLSISVRQFKSRMWSVRVCVNIFVFLRHMPLHIYILLFSDQVSESVYICLYVSETLLSRRTSMFRSKLKCVAVYSS